MLEYPGRSRPNRAGSESGDVAPPVDAEKLPEGASLSFIGVAPARVRRVRPRTLEYPGR